jgi:hypothetical protein
MNLESEVAVVRPAVKRNAFDPKTEPQPHEENLLAQRSQRTQGQKRENLAREAYSLDRCVAALRQKALTNSGLSPRLIWRANIQNLAFPDKILPFLLLRPPRPLREVSIFVGF